MGPLREGTGREDSLTLDFSVTKAIPDPFLWEMLCMQ